MVPPSPAAGSDTLEVCSPRPSTATVTDNALATAAPPEMDTATSSVPVLPVFAAQAVTPTTPTTPGRPAARLKDPPPSQGKALDLEHAHTPRLAPRPSPPRPRRRRRPSRTKRAWSAGAPFSAAEAVVPSRSLAPEEEQ